MPAEGRENPLLKKGNSDAFFREKYLTKNTIISLSISDHRARCQVPLHTERYRDSARQAPQRLGKIRISYYKMHLVRGGPLNPPVDYFTILIPYLDILPIPMVKKDCPFLMDNTLLSNIILLKIHKFKSYERI